MASPNDRKYSAEHEWVVVDGDVATVGISEFAQDQLGDVVYVDLPAEGDSFVAGETFGEIESVKSVSELYAPLAGEVVEVNGSLGDDPETINRDPYGDGWMIKVRMSDTTQVDDLMSAEEYDATTAQA